jgi:ankyrin repeat protein
LALVKCLVKDLGADVNQAMNNGSLAVHLAARTGNLDLLRYLVEEFGPVINNATEDGCTPLFIAGHKGHVTAVRYLKKLGADINRAAIGGTTPFFIAAENGHASTVRYPAKYLGTSVDRTNAEGTTSMFCNALSTSSAPTSTKKCSTESRLSWLRQNTSIVRSSDGF